MSRIDYSKYFIQATPQFEKGLMELKQKGFKKEIDKLFRVIEEIVEGADMYKQEYARPLKTNTKMMHIPLDGRKTGNIILLYRVNGTGIEIDLQLHNITDHKNLTRQSKRNSFDTMNLQKFDVIMHKYSQVQRDYVEECYMNLIAEPRFHQIDQVVRSDYVNKYLEDYYNKFSCEDPLTLDQFYEIMYYFQDKYQKPIFGASGFNSISDHALTISEYEEKAILNMFSRYSIYIDDAYVESEVDEYEATYQQMYVEATATDFRDFWLLEFDLYSLKRMFDLVFESRRNGLGRYGKTYVFYHHFVE